VSVQSLLVPQSLPTQNEPTHINIRQQRRERGPLRAAPALVLVAGRPMMPPPPMGFPVLPRFSVCSHAVVITPVEPLV
jgi:hypothetical protein